MFETHSAHAGSRWTQRIGTVHVGGLLYTSNFGRNMVRTLQDAPQGQTDKSLQLGLAQVPERPETLRIQVCPKKGIKPTFLF